MIDYLLDDAPWALAAIVAVIAVCLTWNSVASGQQKTQRYDACVKAGGTVTKVENDVPFCQGRK